MEKGDENTKFFQAFAKGRKLSNTIMEPKNNQGQRSLLLRVLPTGEKLLSDPFQSR
jgi:hypothetical protein